MPEDFATRQLDDTVHPKTGEYKELYDWGLKRFVDEARTLARFTHPNIVRVLSVFEENNTAYMIMEYAQGQDLSSIYKKSGTMSEAQLLDIFIPVMGGLARVHKEGFIHRDIKPANIYICDNDAPLLLDFGSARQSIGGKTRALTSLVTYGYAPFEQYNEGSGKQGPWTDIYSLGASLYVGVTGDRPADALSRGGGFIDTGMDTYIPASIVAKGKYSDHFLRAIDHALMFKIENRPSDVEQCADMLLGKVFVPELPDFMLNDVLGDRELCSPANTIVKDANRIQSSLVNANMNHQGVGQPRPGPPKRRSVIAVLLVISVIVIGVIIGGYLDRFAVPDGSAVVQSDQQQLLDKARLEKQQEKARQQKLKQQQEKDKKLAKETAREKALKKRIDKLLSGAVRLSSKGHFVTPANKNAYAYYQKVLTLQSGNIKAKRGLKSIEKELISLANAAYFDKQYSQSLSYLQQLESINPDSSVAKSLRDRIKFEQNQDAQIATWLKEAKKHMKNSRFTSPSGNNAYEVYKKILIQRPQSIQALQGIEKVRKYYITLFNKHISTTRLNKAQRDISTMKKVGVSAGDIKKMQRQLKVAQKKQLAEKQLAEKPVVQKPQPRKLSIEQASQKISQFKVALQTGNKGRLKQISRFVPGREAFVDQLLSQYKKINVKISNFKLIASQNKAQAQVTLNKLVDIKGNNVTPGSWSQFEITLSYSANNILKIH
ncbi:Serine/threonine protein kinase, partial [hydrothermal vent metagenome]